MEEERIKRDHSEFGGERSRCIGDPRLTLSKLLFLGGSSRAPRRPMRRN